MPRKKPPTREAEPTAAVRLGTIANTNLAIDLFATMLRSVRITREQRLAEEKRNGRTNDEARTKRE